MISRSGHKSLTITRSLLPGFLFLALSFSCRNSSKEIDAVVSKSTLQEDKAEDVIIIYSKDAKVQARLFAKEFVRNEVAKPPYTDMRKGLKVEFYDDSARIKNTLVAKYARYYEKDQNILLRDSIVIVNKKGEQLSTEELVWNQKLRKFYTEKFVRIKTPDQIMYGDGMEANEDFSWYQITNIKGIIQVNKAQVPGE